MTLKRSTIKTHISALPVVALLLGATACTADDAEPTPSPSSPATSSDGIALTIPLSATRSATDGFALTDDQLGALFVATYDADGNIIETIVSKGEVLTRDGEENAIGEIHNVGSFGSVLSVMLPTDIYGDASGIQVAAVYLPDMDVANGMTAENFVAPEKLDQLYESVQETYLLTLPKESSVWQPTSEMNIPMAGILDITSAIEGYDPALWNENNPMFLTEDPLRLERAMAKVVVTEGEGVGYFSKVIFNTPEQGTVMPALDNWNLSGDGHVTDATPVGDSTFDQYYTPEKPEGENDNAGTDYTFYTFETNFTDDKSRELIHIEWKSVTSASDDPQATKDVAVKYYGDANTKTEFGANANCWKGILRNHEYHFTIGRPQEQEVTIQLKVNEWVPDRYSVDL